MICIECATTGITDGAAHKATCPGPDAMAVVRWVLLMFGDTPPDEYVAQIAEDGSTLGHAVELARRVSDAPSPPETPAPEGSARSQVEDLLRAIEQDPIRSAHAEDEYERGFDAGWDDAVAAIRTAAASPASAPSPALVLAEGETIAVSCARCGGAFRVGILSHPCMKTSAPASSPTNPDPEVKP